jgi:hypothetical protein
MQQDNYGDIQIYWLDIARFVMGVQKRKKHDMPLFVRNKNQWIELE